MAQDKLKLEQDVTGKDGEETVTKKKDVARLLKVRLIVSRHSNIYTSRPQAALGVELKEKQIGDVGKVFTEL